MAGIGCLEGVAGAIPKISPYLLPPQYATLAKNCLVHGGVLTPEPRPKSAHTVAAALTSPVSIFKLGDRWFAWETVVKAIRGQTSSSDALVYYTGDGYPKYTRESFCGVTKDAPAATPVGRRLGVVPPTTGLTVTQLPADPGTTEIDQVTGYVYTVVTEEGFESAPNEASPLVTLLDGQYVCLSGFSVPDPSSSNNKIVSYRVYRLVTGADGQSEYYHIKVRPVSLTATPVWDVDVTSIDAGTPYIYDADNGTSPTGVSEDIGSLLSTADYLQPPAALKGIVQMENGVLAGFVNSRVYLSELNIPYSFPLVNQYDMDHTVVALGVYKSNLIILTEGHPYVLYGNDPVSMTKMRWPENRRCVSADGVVELANGVVFPCEEGLYFLDGQVGQVVTEELFSPEQWRDLGPENFLSFFHDEDYVAINTDTGVGLRVNLKKTSVGVVTEDTGATLLFIGKALGHTDNAVYLLADDSVIYEWSSDASAAEYVWEKVFRVAGARNFSAAKIVGDFASGAKSVDLSLYDAAGNLVWTITRTQNGAFRLPPGERHHEMTIKLKGDAEVHRFALAESMQELSNV